MNAGGETPDLKLRLTKIELPQHILLLKQQVQRLEKGY
jgi:hypothetical protein